MKDLLVVLFEALYFQDQLNSPNNTGRGHGGAEVKSTVGLSRGALNAGVQDARVDPALIVSHCRQQSLESTPIRLSYENSVKLLN